MHLSTWFIGLIFGCIACSKPSPPPEPLISGPYGVTALLNDSTWYGSAYAYKAADVAGVSACTLDRFGIGFSTDLPFDNTPPKRTITGCLGDCTPTQMLGIHNIPLAVGKYNLADLNSCGGQYGAVEYFWLLGGDGIINTFGSQTSQAGWIQVTGYNASQHAVEGTFEFELSSETTKSARFQKGVFKALLN